MTSRSAYHVEPWPAPGSWVDDALCAQADPDLFHPTDRTTSCAAVAICRRCSVQADCGAYIMAHERDWSRDGVWGGLTPVQRHNLHKRAPARLYTCTRCGIRRTVHSGRDRGRAICRDCQLVLFHMGELDAWTPPPTTKEHRP